VLWLTPHADEMTEQDWNFPEGRFLAYLLGSLDEDVGPLFVVLNGAPTSIEFKLPDAEEGTWTQVLDSTVAAAAPKRAPLGPGATLQAPPRSVLVFAGEP
jgi:glycogen operon protein